MVEKLLSSLALVERPQETVIKTEQTIAEFRWQAFRRRLRTDVN